MGQIGSMGVQAEKAGEFTLTSSSSSSSSVSAASKVWEERDAGVGGFLMDRHRGGCFANSAWTAVCDVAGVQAVVKSDQHSPHSAGLVKDALGAAAGEEGAALGTKTFALATMADKGVEAEGGPAPVPEIGWRAAAVGVPGLEGVGVLAAFFA